MTTYCAYYIDVQMLTKAKWLENVHVCLFLGVVPKGTSGKCFRRQTHVFVEGQQIENMKQIGYADAM